MASPQLEHGYVRIANPLLERLYRLPIAANNLRVLLWVIRDSYGRNRKHSLAWGANRISRELMMPESSVKLAVRVLLEANILRRDDLGRWSLNKDWDTWTDWAAQGGQPTDPPGQSADPGGSPLTPKGSAHRPQGGSPLTPSPYARGKTDTKTAKTGSAAVAASDSYEIKTPVQRVMAAYKRTKGVPIDDRAWDKAQWPRWARAANKLLQAFAGQPNPAISYLAHKSDLFTEKGLDWNLDTIARQAWDDPEVTAKRLEAARD